MGALIVGVSALVEEAKSDPDDKSTFEATAGELNDDNSDTLDLD